MVGFLREEKVREQNMRQKDGAKMKWRKKVGDRDRERMRQKERARRREKEREAEKQRGRKDLLGGWVDEGDVTIVNGGWTKDTLTWDTISGGLDVTDTLKRKKNS